MCDLVGKKKILELEHLEYLKEYASSIDIE